MKSFNMLHFPCWI